MATQYVSDRSPNHSRMPPHTRRWLTLAQAVPEVGQLTPSNPHLLTTIESMKTSGIGFVYGEWLTEGRPRVLLIDTSTAYLFLNEWKRDLWKTTGISIPAKDNVINETVIFGYLVAWFLGEVRPQDDFILSWSWH